MKNILFCLAFLLIFGLTTIPAQQDKPVEPESPSPVSSSQENKTFDNDGHKHRWDDMRLLLITLTEITTNEIRWKHSTTAETKIGHWAISKRLLTEPKGFKSGRIKKDRDYIAVYCCECQNVIWLYDAN